MIRPCRLCKNPDLQYIHRTCLERFADERAGRQALTHCTCCKDPYLTMPIPPHRFHPFRVLVVFLLVLPYVFILLMGPAFVWTAVAMTVMSLWPLRDLWRVHMMLAHHNVIILDRSHIDTP